MVSLACSVVFVALSAGRARAADPHTGTRSAQLSVSATVVRSCTLATPAMVVVGDETVETVVGDSVRLACSRGDAAALEVGPPSVQSALYAQLAREVDAQLAAPQHAASDPLVVTVLF